MAWGDSVKELRDDTDRDLRRAVSRPSTNTSLLMRVRQQEPRAWSRLVYLYGPVVYAWCRRVGLQDSDAEEVGQEVFRAVASGIERFRRESGSDTFRGWLWGIAQNKLKDHWRRQSKQPAALGGSSAQKRFEQLAEPATANSLDPGGAGEALHVLRRACELVKRDFQERSWNAFWQVTVEEKPPAEVAEALCMSRTAVYIAKSRILHRLRRELEDLEELGLDSLRLGGR